ncbi:MAG TPA: hypothetical protein VF215_14650 [Thermoanaerobaculia bacterium]
MKRAVFCALLFVAVQARGEQPVFSGFIDLAAAWNANRPANHDNFVPGTGTSAKRANEGMLNL